MARPLLGSLSPRRPASRATVANSPVALATCGVFSFLIYSWLLVRLGSYQRSPHPGGVVEAPWGSRVVFSEGERPYGFDPIDVVYTWVNGSDEQMLADMVRWKKKDHNITEISTANRYRDNEELRYSLRSVHMYAPWVRRIFIVTNGQVPRWLNTSHPQVTLVTHREIFQHRSHLPTFSSPAIEMNLHRIPGLSRRFLYFNDDVFLAQPAYPSDWLTAAPEDRLAHRVFLTWPIPTCADGCRDNWLGDRTCDRSCNVEECAFDHGDCEGGAAEVDREAYGGVFTDDNYEDLEDNYRGLGRSGCPSVCLEDLIGNEDCDEECNTENCAFDGGECAGLDGLHCYRPNITMQHGLTSFNQPYNATALLAIPALQHSASIDLATVFPGGLTHVSYNNSGFVSVGSFPAQSPTTVVLVFGHRRSAPAEVVVTNGALLEEEEGEEEGGEAKATSQQAASTPGQPFVLRIVLVGVALTAQEEEEDEEVVGDWGEGEYDEGEGAEFDYEFEQDAMAGTGSRAGAAARQEGLSIDADEISLQRRKTSRHLLAHSWYPAGGQDSRQGHLRRLLMDTFGSSLRHVDRLLTAEFGHQERRVPAHMPHMLDVRVLSEIQSKWPEEWKSTSSHRFRSSEDMQFAFTYYNYLLESTKPVDASVALQQADVDRDRLLDPEELLSLALRAVKQHSLVHPKRTQAVQLLVDALGAERLPANSPLTYDQVLRMQPLMEAITDSQQAVARHRTVKGDSNKSRFIMLTNNATAMRSELDNARSDRQRYLFLCLNDNLDETGDAAGQIPEVLREVRDFLRHLYPIPSPFEAIAYPPDAAQPHRPVANKLLRHNAQKLKHHTTSTTTTGEEDMEPGWCGTTCVRLCVGLNVLFLLWLLSLARSSQTKPRKRNLRNRFAAARALVAS